jgi:AhpD family alkylhydroperoxidase
MTDLTSREIELVAIGAALGSNCVPCIEFHIPEAHKAGLTAAQIREAIQYADKVRQAPAQKVLDIAKRTMDATFGTGDSERTDAWPCADGNQTASKRCC